MSDSAIPAAAELDTLRAAVVQAAARHGWTAVTEAAAALPQPDDRTVLLCASPKADVPALAERLRTCLDGREPLSASLESLHADPGPALSANRVVLALGCAELLGPEAAEAAAALAARPPGTVVVVLTGAEALTGDGDLDLVARRIWRLLYAGPDEQWAGGDPEWLLWTGAEAPEVLRERLARDAAALEERLTGEVAAPAGLQADRIAHLLDLASGLIAEQTRARPADPAQRRAGQGAAARIALTDGRRGLLRTLDGEAAAAEQEVAAALRMLEQDLLRDVKRFLESHREELSEPARVRSLVGSCVDRGVGRWAATTGPGLRARAARIDFAVSELFHQLDEALRACGATPGSVGAVSPVSLDGALLASVNPSAGRAAPGRSAGMATEVVVGGVLGAAAGAVLTSGLGTVLGAGVGAAAGGMLHHRQAEQQLVRATAYGRDAVRKRVAGLSETVPGAVRREVGALRRAVEQTLDRAGRELNVLCPPQDSGRDAPEAAPATGRGATAEAAAELDALRRRLAAVTI
ncbi:hypothetical protein [Streptomyces hygroscopicus]|uniref:hypothetical protein n=1 Tax=Streptomyces hygroscopicus TaxID=1912 RepID=UPI00223F0FD7|nr:hypothetical protein [Streptomyces hygroscopicus]